MTGFIRFFLRRDARWSEQFIIVKGVVKCVINSTVNKLNTKICIVSDFRLYGVK